MIRHFHTLAHSKKLIEAGMPQDQAEAHTYALAEAMSTALATKADVVTLEGKLAELKLTLRQEVEAGKSDLLKWMFGLAAGQVGVLIALLKLLPGSHP